MATVSTQQMPASGAALTYSAASVGGDKFTPARATFMHVRNASVASINVTLVTPGTVEGLTVEDRIVAVPAGGDRLIPLPAHVYGGVDGLADVTWSASASVTFAVARIA